MKALQRFSDVIDKINLFLGKSVSWCTLLLLVVVCVDVVRKLLFNRTEAWIMELEWHLFALIFLLSAGYTFLQDRHVRVDVFYSQMSKRDRAWVNLIGIAVLLLPWCIILIYWSLLYAFDAYQLGEGSPNPNGLPARWIIKMTIPLGLIFLALQALSEMAKNILLLISTKHKN